MKRALQLLFALASAAFAQASGQRAKPTGITTPSAVTCHQWRKIDTAPARTIYVLGGFDVLLGYVAETVSTQREANVKLAQYVPIDLSADEAREGVDQFCAHPENAPVPVYNALKIVSLKAMGIPPRRSRKQRHS